MIIETEVLDTVIGQFTIIGKFSILRYSDKSDPSVVALVQDTDCMGSSVFSQWEIFVNIVSIIKLILDSLWVSQSQIIILFFHDLNIILSKSLVKQQWDLHSFVVAVSLYEQYFQFYLKCIYV